MTDIQIAKNPFGPKPLERRHRTPFQKHEILNILNFQESNSRYTKTPLYELKELAKKCGVASIMVKDESQRFGLNAFKVLGGIVAVGKYMARVLDLPFENLSFDMLKQQAEEKLQPITFITATDGNHGRGVAWAARELGQKAVVRMPKGSTTQRLKVIQEEGADVLITDLNYDDCVRHCATLAKENGGIMIQDTAWDGYEEIPLWIMQGYSTLALEIVQQLEEQQLEPPTHILLQAGVGSFAGAVAVSLNQFLQRDLTIGIVEAKPACCFFESFRTCKMKTMDGDMQTIMAGLACGEPNTFAYDLLSYLATAAFSCTDEIAALGMRVYGNPITGDPRVISGESGAVTLGLLYYALQLQASNEIVETLHIGADARILVISTEGDTDRNSYENIVWHGQYANFKEEQINEYSATSY